MCSFMSFIKFWMFLNVISSDSYYLLKGVFGNWLIPGASSPSIFQWTSLSPNFKIFSSLCPSEFEPFVSRCWNLCVILLGVHWVSWLGGLMFYSYFQDLSIISSHTFFFFYSLFLFSFWDFHYNYVGIHDVVSQSLTLSYTTFFFLQISYLYLSIYIYWFVSFKSDVELVNVYFQF